MTMVSLRVGLSCMGMSAWLFLSVGCGDSSSPSAAGPSPVPVSSTTVTISDPNGLLTPHQDLINTLMDQALAQVRTAFPSFDPVRITVFADAQRSIPGYGIGGFALNGQTFEIAINPAFADLARILRERLAGTVAHEAHHVMRFRGPGYGTTLLESMISEGLADHFAVELLGVDLPPWSRAFAEEETETFLGLARPLFDSSSFDFDAWFFGTRSDLPRWVGYTLGYRLVEAYQSQNPGRSAAQLVNTPAQTFRPN